MAFDFPASPLEDQTFTPPGGPTYVYKAPRWLATNVASGAVPEAPNTGTAYVRQALAWVAGYTAAAIDALLATKTTTAYVDSSVASREPTIAAGTTSQYWRGDKSWQTLPAAGIADAPNDGTLYGRKSAAWSAVPAGIVDAPSDGNTYGRKNAAWATVVSGASVSDTAPSSPANGQFWLDSTTMNLYIWYTDPNTSQWVQINNVGAG
jgi:hypothetical protein